ncbi:MAG: hypothetical protein JXR10_16415 [Cyclobacteriaceae bacterium]
MRIVQLFGLTLLLFSCRTESDKLIGHWHSVHQEDGHYWTLDVTDSSTTVNKYDIETSEPETIRFDKNGDELIVFMWEEYRNFNVTNDTLVIAEHYRFVRVDEEYHMNDIFLGSLVKINLPKSTKISRPDLLEGKQWEYILVGSDKNENPSELSKIQTNNVFSSLTGLPIFAQIQSDKWSSKNPNYWLVIHADSLTSELLINSIRTSLEPFDFIEGFFVSRFNYELDRLEYEELNGR